MYDMVKFERGQVWMVRFRNPGEAYGHEQNKDRPWLIVSVGKFNKSSGMCTMVPITTREFASTPAQVLFYNERDQKNVILCEQIRSFDTKSGAYTFDYMGNLSDAIMEKVDVALSVHLGMHYSPITLKNLQESVEAVVKSVGHMQTKADTPKFTDQDVAEFATKLQESAKANLEVSIEAPAASVAFSNNKTPEVEVAVTTKPSKTADKDDGNKSKGKHRRNWTTAKIEEYLNDCNTLPMKAIMDKWGFKKKSDVYSTKAYLKGKINK